MSVTLSASKHLKLLRLLKSPNPSSSSSLLLRHLCAEPDPQPPKHDDEAIEATVTRALELLKQTPQHDWATCQPLHTLLFSSDPSSRVLVGITRRLPSHSAALNFVDYLRSNNSGLQDAQVLSSAFLAVLELAKREMDSLPELLSELYRVSKEWKVQLNVKAAVLLIRCFERAQMVDESVLVFDELDPSLKNTHVCNVFIGVLLKAGRIDDALNVLDGMLQPESEVPLNDAIADTFLQALLKKEHIGIWLSMEEIIELVLKFGEHYVFPNSIMITKLIARLCGGRKFDQAWNFLRELMNLHAPIEAPCFNVILTELGRNGDVDRMNSLLREMKDADIQPDIITFGILINTLCKLRRVDAALDVFKKMREGTDGVFIEADVVTYNTLIDGLCKVGRQEEGLAMMEQMRSLKGCAPNSVTYNCLIDGFCKGGEIDKAQELFDQMNKEGIVPNVVTVSILIDGMCRHGRINSAFVFFNEMQGKGVRANAVTYTTLINAFCNANNIDKAVKLFDQMLKSGSSADAIVHHTLISGLSQAGRMNDASKLLSKLKEAGFRPNTVCYNVLIGGFCKRNKLNKACEIVKEMEEAGMKPDVVTYNTLITYFSRAGDFSAAESLMKKMIKEGLVPTVATYGALIHARCLTGQIDEALKIFENISKSKLLPNTIIYNVLVEALCKNNKVEDAFSLMDDMKVKGVKPDTSTYNSMFQVLKEKNSLEEAFKLMDRMITDACNPDYITMEILTEWLSAVGEINKLKIFLRGHNLSPAPA